MSTDAVYVRYMSIGQKNRLDLLRTAAPFFGQTGWNLSGIVLETGLRF